MFNVEDWAITASHIQGLPGSTALGERIRRAALDYPWRKGSRAWREIGDAMTNCNGCPYRAFDILHASGDFDVRWPLTFAAWYWGASGASVDDDCAYFLSDAGLWDQALEVLPEYAEKEWLSVWRIRIEQCIPKHFQT